MSDTQTYYVMREHFGDKDYVRGDTRDLNPNDAAHLVRLGVLSETKPEPKAEKPAGKKGKAAAKL